MQTFLPYSDFNLSAQCLDNKRLNKQILETWQIYQSLTITSYGWKHHPAVKMWKGYESKLLDYGLCVYLEWKERSNKDHKSGLLIYKEFLKVDEFAYPYWFGDDKFHSSHRAALLYKDYTWYKQFAWNELPAIPNVKGSLPYYWPVR